jgi:GntR family transcriptional repressor for pyruvate dehydrogenase complex
MVLPLARGGAAPPRQPASSCAGAGSVAEAGAALDVLERLRCFIEQSGLRPGMKLPPERALAQQMSIGRPALREAIKALSVLDVIESRRGDGTYIKSLAAIQGGWPAGVRLAGAHFDMIELLEVRKMFEPRAAALAASRATQRQLKEIERPLIAQEAQPDDRRVLQRQDYLFHEAILQAAGNHVLNDVHRFLAPLLLQSRRITARTTPDVAKIVRQHRTIFEAIRIGESELAEGAMREHLQTVALDLLSDPQPPAPKTPGAGRRRRRL